MFCYGVVHQRRRNETGESEREMRRAMRRDENSPILRQMENRNKKGKEEEELPGEGSEE